MLTGVDRGTFRSKGLRRRRPGTATGHGEGKKGQERKPKESHKYYMKIGEDKFPPGSGPSRWKELRGS
jgi:hypothetical protein